MSASFPVVKGKRPKSSREPNKSFVKNVTSRVSGLLPSTITKWFSGQSSSTANGSVTLAESTDSSTEDEATESPIITQPAAKRMRYSSQTKTTHYTPINTKCSSTNTESIEPFNTTQSPAGRNVFRREPSFVSTPLQPNIEESTVPENNVNSYNLHSPSTSTNDSLDRKRKSLFDKTQDFESTFERVVARSPSTRVIDLSQPYFKAGLMCSPFYTGRTNYGGAAGSYMNQPNIKRRKITLVRDTSNNNHVTISHSARRVMDILENYSSPLTEAKRIPQYSGSPNSSLSLDTTDSNRKNQSYKTQELHVPNIASIIRLKQKSRLMDTTNAARQIIASHSSSAEHLPYPTSLASKPPKVTKKDELTTKIKSRLTRINRDSDESMNAPEPVNLPTLFLNIDHDNLPKFSFSATPAPPSTSSTVTVSATVEVNSKTTNTKDRMDPSTDKEMLGHDDNKSEKNTNDLFKFSSPVKVSLEPSTNATSTYSFGSPERNLDKTNNQIGVIVSPTSGTQSKQSKDVNKKNDTAIECSCNNSELQSKSSKCTVCEKKASNIEKSPMAKKYVSDKWKCADCWVENDSTNNKCVCCGGEKPGKNSTEPKANQIQDNSNRSNKWKCTDCWVENDSPSNKCICCGGGKPGDNLTQPKSNQIQANKNLSNKWQCKDCWVYNESSASKCICCGGGKPDESANQSKTNQIQINSNLCSKWQCKDCWVQNDSSASKCVCCGGVKVTTNSNEKESNNSVTINKETTNDWKCNDCWVKNKNTSNKCVACGGARLGSKEINNSSTCNEPKTITTTTAASLPLQNIVKSQTDTWECPICLVRNENNRSMCVCCEADKPGSKKEPESKFSFKDNPGAVFKFGINPKESTIAKSTENQSTAGQTPIKESEANSVKESEANNNVLPKASTFTFGIPKTTQENKLNNEDGKKEEPAKVNFTFGIKTSLLTSQSGETAKPAFTLQFKKPEETETNAKSVPEKTVDTSKVETPLSILSSAPKISISSNLFAASPITTQSTNKISISSAILSHANESVPTVSKESLSNVTPSTSLTILPTTSLTTSAIKVPQSTFTFSAAPIKPSVNLFAAPVSQASTASSSFASLQPTTVTSNVSLFNKTDAVNTSAIPLFQKNDSTPVSLSLFGTNNISTTTTVAAQPTTSSTPMFRFRNLGDYSTAPQTEKPKFNFTFGNTNNNETSSMFKATFGNTSENNKFTLPAANTLGTSNTLTGNALGGNGLPTGNNSTSNIMPGINGLPSGNTLLGSEITPNQLNTGNALSASGSVSTAPTTGLFGNPLQKNMWTPNNPSTGNAPVQLNTINYEKPATFTFGSSTPFNSNTSNTAFGTPQQQTQNVFGITNQNNNNSQPSLFSNTIQSPAASNIFGAPAPASNATPAMGLFGSPNIGATPTFGTPNASMPTFEAPSVTPTPSFNFSSQATSGVFGFSQQQPQQQQTGGVYNFGATSGSAPQVQFNIGSAPNSTTRRVRKAVRRTTQR